MIYEGGTLLFIRSLTFFVALAITLIALRSFARFRSWRLFFLAAAFFLLSLPPALDFIRLIWLPMAMDPWALNRIEFISYMFTLASVVAFALIAYVYWDEKKTRSIQFSRGQIALCVLLIAAQLSFFLFASWWRLSEISMPDNLTAVLYLAFTNVSCILTIFIIISLYSYYRTKRTANTLVAMVGFILILLGQAYGVYSSIAQELLSNGFGNQKALSFIAVFELLGYLAFLIALVRLRLIK
jgi:hypothetical protein